MKNLLIFLGADKTNYNIALNCFDYICKTKDLYKVVLTDDDEHIIEYLKIKGIDYIDKNNINNLINSVNKNEYDWLLNLWGHKLFKEKFLHKFKNNLNLHPSCLPYGRGKDCAVWTIYYNFKAGATLHKMTKDLDCGPIYYQEIIDYSFPTTGYELYERCCKLCLDIFLKSWIKIRDKDLLPTNQDSGNHKTFYRRELYENNVVNLDDDPVVKNFVLKSISQDFSPNNFSLKIVTNGKVYNYRSVVELVE